MKYPSEALQLQALCSRYASSGTSAIEPTPLSITYFRNYIHLYAVRRRTAVLLQGLRTQAAV